MARKRYQNYDGINNTRSFSELLKWHKERRTKQKDLSKQIPQSSRKEIEQLKKNRHDFSLTWIGHSTFLIQTGGMNILTDPVWDYWMGTQKRLTQPGIDIMDLPEIDAVLISHGHYDHLSFSSIKKLNGDISFFVPVGLKEVFSRKGFTKVTEGNWWETFSYKNINLTFVPAQHWTKRSLWDTNASHWGGWVIESPDRGKTVYFAGDTGYFRGFKEIGERFTITYAIMPIGAYEPEWFMSDSHINPEDAITAFLEVKADLFIPMHYGAYRLADDTGSEALERLYVEWERLKLPSEKLKVLKLGETLWGKRIDSYSVKTSEDKEVQK
ncbi:MBL fold metallo-hydrolase [Pseudalkalibacillus caeni]|uniref:MBL fold metallo-hydrolase n=1 Tax=Exobacillus caeni TaxID=2574798 RepID=A0A5R9F125_9BACL|nr:MBL fold metallo-hydrolase [Pseudalkalibacillus caeni]TLS36130.1 MBL fold metallo-hydrolase [Pseudalkalibacillus caeni]